MVRSISLEIRSEIAPQPTRLRPNRYARWGFCFVTSHQIFAPPRRTKGSPARRRKVFFMSPDPKKYQRLAEAHGEADRYDEAALLRLYSVLEELVPRIATEHCPHLFPPEAPCEGRNLPRLGVDPEQQEKRP
jgi:hypothetical protein